MTDSNRTRPELRPLLGMLLTLAAARVDADPGKPFRAAPRARSTTKSSAASCTRPRRAAGRRRDAFVRPAPFTDAVFNYIPPATVPGGGGGGGSGRPAPAAAEPLVAPWSILRPTRAVPWGSQLDLTLKQLPSGEAAWRPRRQPRGLRRAGRRDRRRRGGARPAHRRDRARGRARPSSARPARPTGGPAMTYASHCPSPVARISRRARRDDPARTGRDRPPARRRGDLWRTARGTAVDHRPGASSTSTPAVPSRPLTTPRSRRR